MDPLASILSAETFCPSSIHLDFLRHLVRIAVDGWKPITENQVC
jgi:hypothetical protein